MIRGNYQAWRLQPAEDAEITPRIRRNVQRLSKNSNWVWAMNDGGASQPTPIVHNGVIYLANTE
jgi:hypothetical protein